MLLFHILHGFDETPARMLYSLKLIQPPGGFLLKIQLILKQNSPADLYSRGFIFKTKL